MHTTPSSPSALKRDQLLSNQTESADDDDEASGDDVQGNEDICYPYTVLLLICIASMVF